MSLLEGFTLTQYLGHQLDDIERALNSDVYVDLDQIELAAYRIISAIDRNKEPEDDQ